MRFTKEEQAAVNAMMRAARAFMRENPDVHMFFDSDLSGAAVAAVRDDANQVWLYALRVERVEVP